MLTRLPRLALSLGIVMVLLGRSFAESPPQGEVKVAEITYAENLGFVWLGTITGANATILIKILATNEIKAYRVGYTFLDKYVIEKIGEKSLIVSTLEGKHILVNREAFVGEAGQTPETVVEAPKPDIFEGSFKEDGFERDGKSIKVSQDYWKKIKGDLPAILMQAGTEPVTENGQITGFRMYSIDENSIYAKAGLKDGDIITTIKGTKLNSVAGAVSVLQSLKNTDGAPIPVEIQRSGQSTTVDIQVQ